LRPATLTPLQLRKALRLHLFKALAQDAFQAPLTQPLEIISFRTPGGVQRLEDGEHHVGGVGIENDPTQLIEGVGARHAVRQT
jgi:hypothetical protein